MENRWLNQDDELYRYLLPMTVVASGIIFFWGTWSLPIVSLNEGRRMLVVKEMLAGQHWLIPTINEEIYITKPPLFYWVAAIFALLLRTTAEWVLRLPSLLSALFITWFTFARVKKYAGRWPALFAAIILITSYKFTLYARRAEIEMLLALCCTVALFLFLDFLKKPEVRWPLYLSYLFWGLAFLTKGPAALPFFLPPLLVFWLVSKDRNLLRGLFSLKGWAIFALVAFPWYLYCFLRIDAAQWEVFLKNDIMGKTYWAKERDPLYSFLLDFITSFSPWILLIFHKTKERWKELSGSSEAAFWSCWSLVPLIIVASCATKHTKYILPLFPAVAALLGIWTAGAFSELKSRFGPKVNRIVFWAVGTILLGWVSFYSVGEPYLLHHRYSAIKPMIQKIQQIQGDTPVFSYRHKYERLIYYYQRPIPMVTKRKLKKMVREQRSFLLIAEDKDWKELEGKGLCVLAEYRPFLHRDRAARLLASPDRCQ